MAASGASADCVSKIPEAAFLAYADLVETAAQAALRDFGGEYATTDVEKVLCDPRIDAVYICTRHDSHASLAIAAAKAGKHILIEKPLALTMAECEAVARAVEAAGVMMMPAFKMRFYPLVQKAHEFIPNPQVVVGQMMDNAGRRPWRTRQGGANVHSQGCHTTDILRYFVCGEPKRLQGGGGRPRSPLHRPVRGVIQFSSAGSRLIRRRRHQPLRQQVFFGCLATARRSVYDRLKNMTFFDG